MICTQCAVGFQINSVHHVCSCQGVAIWCLLCRKRRNESNCISMCCTDADKQRYKHMFGAQATSELCSRHMTNTLPSREQTYKAQAISELLNRHLTNMLPSREQTYKAEATSELLNRHMMNMLSTEQTYKSQHTSIWLSDCVGSTKAASISSSAGTSSTKRAINSRTSIRPTAGQLFGCNVCLLQVSHCPCG